MILELTTLSSVFWVGYKNWQKQDQEHNKSILTKQKIKLENNGRDKKNIIPFEKRKLISVLTNETSVLTNEISVVSKKELFSRSAALTLSGIGTVLHSPITYLAVPFLLYSIKGLLVTAAKLLRNGKIDIETILSVGILSSILHKKIFLASMLGLFFRMSDILTAKVIQESQQNLVGAFEQIPENVWLLEQNSEVSVPLSKVRCGDILVVNAGEVIPVDGHIVHGMAGIDQHKFTGESLPIEKGEGENVFAMTFVLSGKIHIKVEKAGTETSAMKISEILENTTEYKSLTTLRAEKFSRQMVYPAVLTAAAAWPLLGSNAATAVLFIHPNKRLLFTAPISLLKYLKYAANQGILIKDGRSLELLSQVDTLVFDKTGTLTEDQPLIGTIHPLSTYSQNEILRCAAIAEFKQSHPLAKAILDEAEKRGLSLDVPDQTEYKLGYGVKIQTNGKNISVGSPRFMEAEKILMPDRVNEIKADLKNKGHGLVMVSIDNVAVGVIELLPSVRLESHAIIKKLKSLKQIKKIYIISGDAKAPTQRLAHELGIDYFAETLPHEKSALIEQLQQEGNFVCYIGDGINDTIAMKQAQVSISLSGASRVATDTAQIILLDQGISHLPRVFELANGMNRHMSNQINTTMGVSIMGISGVFLLGWGISTIMLLNIVSLLGTLGYSLIDKPKLNSPKNPDLYD
ncbi:heavy metal translocating P-type ATPase [Crenothrix polyspora]|uniref:P-type Zn(2+) transporter n=1 Tax=Crenothrix polyspora TaxID=360316 RepID=A0A1R4H7I0_9GAMM|nr:heavy metal translocating P-type ATPase [Crenothrix polyspora]SJM92159.1 Cadmium-transporting ATPase [Crenothrix polyspora]